jgi:hypothetical protein
MGGNWISGDWWDCRCSLCRLCRQHSQEFRDLRVNSNLLCCISLLFRLCRYEKCTLCSHLANSSLSLAVESSSLRRICIQYPRKRRQRTCEYQVQSISMKRAKLGCLMKCHQRVLVEETCKHSLRSCAGVDDRGKHAFGNCHLVMDISTILHFSKLHDMTQYKIRWADCHGTAIVR